jgi:hypothetical protein
MRPARETSQSDENACYNTENREQADAEYFFWLAATALSLALFARAALKCLVNDRNYALRTVLRTLHTALRTVFYGLLRFRTVFYGAVRCCTVPHVAGSVCRYGNNRFGNFKSKLLVRTRAYRQY